MADRNTSASFGKEIQFCPADHGGCAVCESVVFSSRNLKKETSSTALLPCYAWFSSFSDTYNLGCPLLPQNVIIWGTPECQVLLLISVCYNIVVGDHLIIWNLFIESIMFSPFASFPVIGDILLRSSNYIIIVTIPLFMALWHSSSVILYMDNLAHKMTSGHSIPLLILILCNLFFQSTYSQ